MQLTYAGSTVEIEDAKLEQVPVYDEAGDRLYSRITVTGIIASNKEG